MAKIDPTDDGIAIAAAQLATALAKARQADLTNRSDKAEQQAMIASFYRWAVDTLVAEHRSQPRKAGSMSISEPTA